MKTRSIKSNYFLNVIRISFGMVLGLLTMPYVNKVLGAESLGKVEYINSIIMYFVLFSALGIPMYGIRETAKVRDNIEERSKLVFELMGVLLVTTIIAYLIIFGVIIHLNYFSSYRSLIIVMSSMVFFSNIGVEWFYQGIEDQLFITVRFVAVRIFAFVLLFLIVKDSNDYLNYAIIVVLTSVGGNVLNIFYLKKHLSFAKLSYRYCNFKRHLKPILTIFVATISVSIYIQLDTIMLGSIAGDKSVGFYVMANKLIRIVIVLITTIGAVMLPRLSSLVHSDKAKYNIYAKKALNYILIIAFPFTVLFFLLAKDLTLLMAGDEFLPSVLTMKILSPIIIIVGIAYFIGFLILYPQAKESYYTVAVVVSAVASVICNIYIIPAFGQYGAAFVAVIAELTGVIIMIVLARTQLKEVKLLYKSIFLFFAGSLVMGSIIQVVSLVHLSVFYEIFISSIMGFVSYVIFLLMFKEETSMEIKTVLLSKIKNNRKVS